jgi:RNA polymerase sigma-70 factor (ECF subfamily)
VRSTFGQKAYNAVPEIGHLLPPHISHLQRYALSLTRNRDSGNDLVQSCLERALAKQHQWEQGSDLRAWLLTIMHNIFISEIRRGVREQKRLRMADIHLRVSDPEFFCWLQEVRDALERLPADRRDLLLSVSLDGISYEHGAESLGLPLGTFRSRLARTRAQLRRVTDR